MEGGMCVCTPKLSQAQQRKGLSSLSLDLALPCSFLLFLCRSWSIRTIKTKEPCRFAGRDGTGWMDGIAPGGVVDPLILIRFWRLTSPCAMAKFYRVICLQYV